jgi:hypothetical protein
MRLSCNKRKSVSLPDSREAVRRLREWIRPYKRAALDEVTVAGLGSLWATMATAAISVDEYNIVFALEIDDSLARVLTERLPFANIVRLTPAQWY